MFLEALYIEDLEPAINTQAEDLKILLTKKKIETVAQWEAVP